jgi:hypothetical protein
LQLSIIAIIILFILALFYHALIRPWQLRWGATIEEIERSMPGDDIVSNPSFNATRAVTIHAPPNYIYPWIAQMGVKRAGWYSYDLLDNLGKPSAESILTRNQNLQVGDVIPMSPDGKKGMRVKDFRKNDWMLWWDSKGDSTWVWGIYPEADNSSRLITRVRLNYRWLSFSIIFSMLVEFFDLPMMRKSMLGIKRRAEAISISNPT